VCLKIIFLFVYVTHIGVDLVEIDECEEKRISDIYEEDPKGRKKQLRAERLRLHVELKKQLRAERLRLHVELKKQLRAERLRLHVELKK